MREILFRGKRLDNGDWVEGYLYEHEPPLVGIVSEKDEPEASKWFIARTGFADWNMPRPVELVEVDPSTVGQYTSLKDKNGKRIFEGDVLKRYYDDLYADDAVIEHVVWFNNGWCANDVTNMTYEAYSIFKDDVIPYAEIIGNIHDNPEFLKEGADND